MEPLSVEMIKHSAIVQHSTDASLRIKQYGNAQIDIQLIIRYYI